MLSRVHHRIRVERANRLFTEYIFSHNYSMFCSEGASGVIDNLKIPDESPHGVSMVTLLPESIDFSALKVIFKIF